MRLKQGQVWKSGDVYLRVVRVERLAVDYKELPSPHGSKGTHHHVTKKEFCRMVKGAALMTEQEIFLEPRKG